MSASQDEVIAFLSTAAAYGLAGAAVERIETHCSIVFLAGDRAYKLKRAVAFSALDYTTLDRREAACRAELALNRRTAPDLYLGIHAIRRRPGGALAIDGEGEPVDWVVVMRRFDQADLLDRLAEAGCLTPALIGDLAAEIARFHAAAEPVAGFGGAEGIRAAIELNLRDHRTVENVLGRDAVENLYEVSLGALGRVALLLDRRRVEGKIKRCHGDLRLANICLLDGRPTLFDAIEFCDRLSCVDVLFDLAFLLMDLDHRGLVLPASSLFNRYLDLTGDGGGLPALPLMLSVRAATRAYSRAGAAQRQTDPRRARHYAAASRSHLARALSLLAEAPGRLIALGGVAGSRTEAIADGLAATFRPAPGARVLRASTIRRRLLALPPEARLPAAAYDRETSGRVHAALADEAAEVIRAGFTAIVDAGFADPAQRSAIAAAARDASAPFLGLWLGAPGDLESDDAASRHNWHAINSGPSQAALLSAARLLAHTAAA